MPPRVAAITMAYNEAALLPIWAAHYARQVGADQCFVVDHGSSEPLSLPKGVNVLRLPRSAHDDQRRARFIAQLAASMLGYFDWVLYSDVDELLCADPALYRDLPSFCAQQTHPTITAIGFDIQHVPAVEPTLDLAAPLGPQRGWMRFTSAMCKPLLTRQPVTWAPGFHSCENPAHFGQLYLFHLHWADRTLGMQRLRKTRLMPWQDEHAGSHQRLNDTAWCRLFDGMADLPRRDSADALESAPLPSLLDQVANSHKGGCDGQIDVDLTVGANELWPIPDRFRHAL
jgi:hypothetical protein